MKIIKRETAIIIACYVISLLSSIWIAIWNGYPLMYPDVGTYIFSGHEGFVPIDRPIAYGLLLRHISLSYSLWLVILFHSIILIYLITRLTRVFVGGNALKIAIMSTVIIILLSLTTGLSYHLSQPLPDIFTPFLIITFYLIAFNPHKLFLIKLTDSIILIISIIVHSSNLPILILSTFLYIFLNLIFNSREVKNIGIRIVLVALLFSVAGYSLGSYINYKYNEGFRFTRGSYMFIMGRLVESKILHQFLQKNCKFINYSLCPVKNDLPEKSYEFIWGGYYYDDECLEKGGWQNCWRSREDEYNEMIFNIIKDPDFTLPLVTMIIKESSRQLITIKNVDLVPMLEDSPILPTIKRYLEDDLRFYQSSNQFQNTLSFPKLNKLQTVVILFSLITLGFLLLTKRINPLFKNWIILIIILLISNAIICATFSNVVDRYQGRIIWLLPLCLFLYLISLIDLRFSTSKQNK